MRTINSKTMCTKIQTKFIANDQLVATGTMSFVPTYGTTIVLFTPFGEMEFKVMDAKLEFHGIMAVANSDGITSPKFKLNPAEPVATVQLLATNVAAVAGSETANERLNKLVQSYRHLPGGDNLPDFEHTPPPPEKPVVIERSVHGTSDDHRERFTPH